MRHEKILTREDGTKIRLDVIFYESGSTNTFEYRVNLFVCKPRARKFLSVHDQYENDWDYRALPLRERREFEEKFTLNYVTESEILEAKTELWIKLKPTR